MKDVTSILLPCQLLTNWLAQFTTSDKDLAKGLVTQRAPPPLDHSSEEKNCLQSKLLHWKAKGAGLVLAKIQKQYIYLSIIWTTSNYLLSRDHSRYFSQAIKLWKGFEFLWLWWRSRLFLDSFKAAYRYSPTANRGTKLFHLHCYDYYIELWN